MGELEYLECLKARRNTMMIHYHMTGDKDWLHEAMDVLLQIEMLEDKIKSATT